MTEVITPREELRRLKRSLTEKVLDRAASDPAWKERYLDDPDAAMREAGFAEEVRRIEEVRQSVGTPHEAEVSGQIPKTRVSSCCDDTNTAYGCVDYT